MLLICLIVRKEKSHLNFLNTSRERMFKVRSLKLTKKERSTCFKLEANPKRNGVHDTNRYLLMKLLDRILTKYSVFDLMTT